MTYDLLSARQAYHALPSGLKSPYHNPDYVVLDAVEKTNTDPVFFIFRKSGEIYYHPLHRVHTPELNVIDFESARGYGGPISTTSDKEFLREALNEYKNFSAEHNVLVEFIRFSPVLENQHYYYGDVWLDRPTCAIDLSDYAIEKNSHGAISNINKALKNDCQVAITGEPTKQQFAAFNRLYNERMNELNADKQYLFTENYVEKIIGGNNAMVLVEHNHEIIAAAIFLGGFAWFEYHLSAANAQGRKFGVINLILHTFALQNQNASAILHLGGGTDQDPDNKLLQFKQGMGKLKKRFYIGKYIHQHERYEELKKINLNNNKRVIFYR